MLLEGMLEALSAILAPAGSLIEQSNKISIVDARGLHGETGGAGEHVGGGNLPDSAVAAVLRYRVDGPIIVH